MIDFIKIRITDEALINQVWSNEILIYQGKSEKRFDDEIKELVTKSYKNLYFTKFQNRLEIKGSLHYFFNDGLHNANDFNIYDCIQTIEQIKELFKLDLNKCKLINLEYGVNVNPIIPVVDLVQNLIYHEKRQFTRPTTHFNYKIAGNEAYKQVKAYDKSVQFPNQCNNTFRFEIKTKQAKFINSLGLFTLQNLTEIKNYDLLINSLLKEWDNVLLFDKSKAVEDKFFNTNFWEEILKNGNRNKFNNQKRLYYKKLGADNLHINIKKIMQAKINHLKSVQIPTTINLETAHFK
ncbi:hypothetical protein BWK63_07475 [Flavobacterium covae]|uniref:Replication-associated protein G2P N-terminal domain-containing protein n=1 Tax=Flavobacterium covae TaxID=2906076 RepID=A0ABW8PI51_9FLAO|nr:MULTISPECIES: hypothetical protein [Flavobacterium]OWP81144.1 hypothetical protein BWK63_07475 [Flavobacterium covae]POR22763.1 hypothetical protein BWK57_04775 [Flavobacterium columnare]